MHAPTVFTERPAVDNNKQQRRAKHAFANRFTERPVVDSNQRLKIDGNVRVIRVRCFVERTLCWPKHLLRMDSLASQHSPPLYCVFGAASRLPYVVAVGALLVPGVQGRDFGENPRDSVFSLFLPAVTCCIQYPQESPAALKGTPSEFVVVSIHWQARPGVRVFGVLSQRRRHELITPVTKKIHYEHICPLVMPWLHPCVNLLPFTVAARFFFRRRRLVLFCAFSAGVHRHRASDQAPALTSRPLHLVL